MDIITKQKLFEICKIQIEQSIALAEREMQMSQEAANSEGKSSAGDKYETSRAQSHIERDRYAKIVAENQNLLSSLLQIDINKAFDKIEFGTIVSTQKSKYFISVGLGKFTLECVDYYAISPNSPIGKLLLGKKKNDIVVFANQEMVILDII